MPLDFNQYKIAKFFGSIGKKRFSTGAGVQFKTFTFFNVIAQGIGAFFPDDTNTLSTLSICFEDCLGGFLTFSTTHGSIFANIVAWNTERLTHTIPSLPVEAHQ
jgi:hypothetical protein